MPVVSLSEISHRYPPTSKSPGRDSLREVSFEVQAGEIFGLLGPNGSGKSTLFKILSTFFPPSSGRAELFGLDCALEAPRIRPLIGVVFQNPSLDKKLTVLENIQHQGRLYGLTWQALARRGRELLQRYGLTARSQEMVESLSGGLKRRLELAKSLLHDPKLLILDEPSTGLDPAARKDLWTHLRELAAASVTVLATTHLMDEAALCGRVAILDAGRLVATGAPKELQSLIGGDVISIESPEPQKLQEEIKKRFALEAGLIESTLRLEKREGHTFIPQLVEAFPGMISSINLGRPTLEDVFVHYTGRRFAASAGEAS